MTTLVHEMQNVLQDDEGSYVVRILGSMMPDGRWEGFLEFLPIEGGAALRTPRETTQSDLPALTSWALGLEVAYQEGALARARRESARPEPAWVPVTAIPEDRPSLPNLPIRPACFRVIHGKKQTGTPGTQLPFTSQNSPLVGSGQSGQDSQGSPHILPEHALGVGGPQSACTFSQMSGLS
jgi:hypothetical protein